MTKTLIKNGRILDPETGFDQVADLLIADGKIQEIGTITNTPDTETIDATNKIVVPGIIDIHVHLRDLAQANKETIKTGTQAALKGGVTTVVAMPNTNPVLDSVEHIQQYLDVIKKDASINVHIAGSITKGLKTEELAELDSYPELGIKFITDDGRDVEDEELLEKAYLKAKELGLVVMTHPEMHSIAPNGVMNKGKVSDQLNVEGQPNEKEWKAIERGVRIALKTRARAHFTHISTKESAEVIRKAKQESDLITCDTTPHHITLTEDLVLEKGGFAKVNPPLRTEEDRLALIEGLKDGTIDCIVTDHAPHEEESKTDDVATSSFGFSQIETSVPTILTELHHKNKIPLIEVIKLITLNPAQLAGFSAGRLQEGSPADITIIDLNEERTVNRHEFVSGGKNSPFDGMRLKGWPIKTIVGSK